MLCQMCRSVIKGRDAEVTALRILRCITSAGGKPKSDKVLSNRLKMKIEDVSEALSEMRENGLVDTGFSGRIYRGRKVFVWKATEKGVDLLRKEDSY